MAINSMGGSSKKGTKVSTPDAPKVSNRAIDPRLLRQTTTNVSNPYGTSEVVTNSDGSRTVMNTLSPAAQRLFTQAFEADVGDGYAADLMEKAKMMIAPNMAARGLPAGSEINDTALLKAAIDARLGANQMVNQDRGLAMALADRASGANTGSIEAAMQPWLQQINRENLEYGNKAANERQSAQNRSNKKGSTMSGLANVGSAAVMASDRRLKENIKEHGQGLNGLKTYLYNYKGNPEVFEGYMADEVQSVDPESVVERNGYLFVTEKYAPVRVH